MLLLGASFAAMLGSSMLILIRRASQGQPVAFGPYRALDSVAILLQYSELKFLLLLI
jgi:hypothetical protein